MLRQILSSKEKNGSKLRLSRGSRRQTGEVTRLVRVLMVDAFTYRVIGAVRRVEIEEKEKCQESDEFGGEAVTRLLGVLEDILHSTAGASMNDLIDCY